MPVILTTVSKVATSIKKVLDKYPVTRGMVTYAILWPSGNLLQQALDGSRTNLDFLEALRYGVYGSCITAPLLYTWIKVLSNMLPGTTLKNAFAKGYVDQLVFAPLNISQFFIGMSLLEGKSVKETLEEWERKILTTWMISLSIWPLIQTFNFTMVAEKNRVMAISLGSFIWMVFLSYMHHTKADELPEQLTTRRIHYDYRYGSLDALESLVGAQHVLNSPHVTVEGWKLIFQAAHDYTEEQFQGDKLPKGSVKFCSTLSYVA